MIKKIIILISLILIGLCAALYFTKPAYRLDIGPVQSNKIPDLRYLDDITSHDILKIIPQPQTGKVEVTELRNSTYFDYMAMNDLMSLHSALQSRENPVALEIKSGTHNFSDLVDGENITREGKTLLLHVPVIIHPSATLVINTGDIPLLLGKGSFISNFGKLFINGSTIEVLQEKTWNKNKFRPYIATWSGGESYFANSRFHNLGYDYAKSYGITFSSSAIMQREEGERPAPKGMMIGNHFEGLYYGFYCYESKDITIAHNTYTKSEIYAVDPHDNSSNLIIAFNDVSGTKKKHGIILSRNVSDSIIYANKSHHNNGSGIMMERNSTGNVIAKNIVEENGADGLVFLESGDNTSRENIVRGNKKSGIRIRNSAHLFFDQDQVSGNGEYGLMAYKRILDDQEKRDLVKDAYRTELDFTIVRTTITGNKKASIRVENADRAALSNLILLGSPKSITGDFAPYNTDIHTNGTLPNAGIILTREKYF